MQINSTPPMQPLSNPQTTQPASRVNSSAGDLAYTQQDLAMFREMYGKPADWPKSEADLFLPAEAGMLPVMRQQQAIGNLPSDPFMAMQSMNKMALSKGDAAVFSEKFMASVAQWLSNHQVDIGQSGRELLASVKQRDLYA